MAMYLLLESLNYSHFTEHHIYHHSTYYITLIVDHDEVI